MSSLEGLGQGLFRAWSGILSVARLEQATAVFHELAAVPLGRVVLPHEFATAVYALPTSLTMYWKGGGFIHYAGIDPKQW